MEWDAVIAPVRREDPGLKSDSHTASQDGIPRFVGESEDWGPWSKVYQIQISALGCSDVLNAQESEEVKVGRSDSALTV